MTMRDNLNLPDSSQLKNSKKKWWLKILSVSVPAVVITLGVSNLLDNPFSDYPISDSNQTSVSDVSDDIPQIDPNAGEYVEPTADNIASKGVSVPGWQSLDIPENQKEVAVDFYNPESNTGLYQLTFELRLPDESEQGYEVLYKSGLIDPGLHIQNITLSHELEAGIYDAVIHVQPYCMDELKTPTNNADMQTQLIVK